LGTAANEDDRDAHPFLTLIFQSNLDHRATNPLNINEHRAFRRAGVSPSIFLAFTRRKIAGGTPAPRPGR
jgi:hypothetical protein